MEYGPPGGNGSNFYGEYPQQIAARQVFPILIELATDSTCPVIRYGELADRIDEYIPVGLRREALKGRKAQWMRLPLGRIWQTLFEYQGESNIEIPYLTTIVVNKNSDLPTMFKEYLGWSDEKIISEQVKVYQFKHWRDVFARLREDPRWDGQ